MALNLQEFLNAAKILHSIDRAELDDYGLILSDNRWMHFRRAPITFLMSASMGAQLIIWRIVEARS